MLAIVEICLNTTGYMEISAELGQARVKAYLIATVTKGSANYHRMYTFAEYKEDG